MSSAQIQREERRPGFPKPFVLFRLNTTHTLIPLVFAASATLLSLPMILQREKAKNKMTPTKSDNVGIQKGTPDKASRGKKTRCVTNMPKKK